MTEQQIIELLKTPPANTIEYLNNQTQLLQLILKQNAMVWLTTPNPQLDNKSPVQVMAEENGYLIVGNLINDMITGNPT